MDGWFSYAMMLPFGFVGGLLGLSCWFRAWFCIWTLPLPVFVLASRLEALAQPSIGMTMVRDGGHFYLVDAVASVGLLLLGHAVGLWLGFRKDRVQIWLLAGAAVLGLAIATYLVFVAGLNLIDLPRQAEPQRLSLALNSLLVLWFGAATMFLYVVLRTGNSVLLLARAPK